jgi:hypothetical protein
VHGISASGEVLIRRQVRRGQVLKVFASLPPGLIGIEACASAHHWSRELQSLGHEVKLMPHGPDGMGDHGPRRALSRAGGQAGGIIIVGRAGDQEVGKGGRT